MNTKKLNHKSKAFLWRVAEFGSIATTTSAGVAVYSLIPEINGGDDIISALQDFQLFEEGLKLNMGVAIPIMIALLVMLFIIVKKNKEFFKDKASLGLIIAIIIMYLAYSVIGLFMSACIGALPSVLASELGFEPAHRRAMEAHAIDKELQLEEKKEELREEVRERRRR